MSDPIIKATSSGDLTARLYAEGGSTARLSHTSPNLSGALKGVAQSANALVPTVKPSKGASSGKFGLKSAPVNLPLRKSAGAGAGASLTRNPSTDSVGSSVLNKRSLLRPLSVTPSMLKSCSTGSLFHNTKDSTKEKGGNGASGSATSPQTHEEEAIQGGAVFESFTESLQLDERYMEEFLTGNFLYLRTKNTIPHFQGQSWGAYDLTPVEHFETDPSNYYTMSRSGVTHFQGTESEFTPLDAWEREYYLFNLMRRISFFDKYPRWKAFAVWKRHIRQKKRAKSSEALQKSLFLLDPDLRGSMLELVNLCFQCREDCKLLELDPSKTYTIEQFTTIQTKKRHLAIAWLANFSEDVRALIRKACDAVLDKVKYIFILHCF
jgi:hypothetical protein